MDTNRDEILDRFMYRRPSSGQEEAIAECRERIIGCAEFLIDEIPNSRDRAVALTALEDALMKMNKAIIFSGPA